LVEAELAEAAGDRGSAETLARDAYARAVALEGDHAVLRTAETRLIHSLVATGKTAEAVEIADEALERRTTAAEPDRELIGDAWLGVAWASWQAGDAARARSALEAAVEVGDDLSDVTEPPELVRMAREVAGGTAS
jgi:hypothetical protein